MQQHTPIYYLLSIPRFIASLDLRQWLLVYRQQRTKGREAAAVRTVTGIVIFNTARVRMHT